MTSLNRVGLSSERHLPVRMILSNCVRSKLLFCKGNRELVLETKNMERLQNFIRRSYIENLKTVEKYC